ncbi:GNAT family N-acetyltransferase [Phenylobacterium sp.]|jgi:ribosomal protein S18 acetylase RimI-like enzyme|uniref:GNAT family N-acetyltransferase n=1 Tax=Phenylobacterium sp. TaxID=1871053 RepID=UPI002F4256F3
MPEPIIRRAGPADAATLSAIGAETFVETFGHLYPPRDLERFLVEAYDLERTRKDLADPAKASWLVEADGQAIGYGLAGPCGLPHPQATPACGEIKRIYFRKAWQGAGLGAALFAEMVGWLQAAGPRAVWIGVWSENHGAQRFYARHGYETVGEYGFEVGDTVDREYILRRSWESYAADAAKTAVGEHNPA